MELLPLTVFLNPCVYAALNSPLLPFLHVKPTVM